MKVTTRVFFVTVLLLAAGFGSYAWREHARQAEQQRAIEAKLAAARAAVDRTRREHEIAERDLAAAVRAAKEAEVAAAATRAAAQPDPALAGWEQKIATLRALLTRRPEWAIPEIGLLSPDEFIFFARDAQLDTEEAQRKALSALRALAKRKFARELHDALHGYAMAHGGRLPTDLGELTSFFATPPPDAVLNRYALTGFASVTGAKDGEWLLYERLPVDELYDTRHLMGVRMSLQTPTNPAVYVVTRALAAYAAANPGRKPEQSAELSAYLEVPLDAATLDEYFTGWKKNPATFGLASMRSSSIIMFRAIGTAVESPK